MEFIFRIYASEDKNGFNSFIKANNKKEAFNIINKKYPYATKIIILN